jgi:hypothetical protein
MAQTTRERSPIRHDYGEDNFRVPPTPCVVHHERQQNIIADDPLALWFLEHLDERNTLCSLDLSPCGFISLISE